MNDWTWVFTPDFGQHGGAFQMQLLPTGDTEIRKVSQVIVGPQGQIGFTKWVPLHAKMCVPVGKGGTYSVFQATPESVEMLDKIWALEGTIIPANGRLFRG